ncbi:MAG: hypothetical protein PHT95_02620 [Candidatus Omnitrophica bacterium]|nr:hypothetical protein [Candidatus Omnitrophota bacterium]
MGFKSPRNIPQGPVPYELYKAVVVGADYYRNGFIVKPVGNAAAFPIARYASTMTGPSNGFGTAECICLPPGTVVMVATIGGHDFKTGADDSTDYIVATLATGTQYKDFENYLTPFLFRGIRPNWYTSIFDTTAASKYADTLPMHLDRGYGRPCELNAGDYALFGQTGVFSMLGKYLAAFGASEFARTLYDAQGHKLKHIAADYSIESLITEYHNRADLGAVSIEDHRGLDISEALGCVGSSPFKYDLTVGLFTPQETTQQPLFRFERYEGLITLGDTETVSVPCITGANTDPVAASIAVSQDSKGYNGERRIVSADIVELSKTPVIYKPIKKSDETKATEVLQPGDFGGADWKTVNGVTEDDYIRNFSATRADELEYNAAGHDAPRVVARPKYWAAETKANIQNKAGISDILPTELEQVARTTQEYPLPDSFVLTDPATGRVKTYYASASFFSQLPDGSVVLSDGYGSEIRMSRGNIYISSALDTFIRPGRDMLAMVPGNAVVLGGDSATLHSSNGFVKIKSETDLELLGANGGTGKVLLESRSLGALDSDVSVKGLHIKSASDVAVTGSDMYLGLNKGTSDSKSGASKEAAGTIVVDSAAGNLNITGSAVRVSGSSLVLSSVTQGACAVLALSGGSAFMASANTQFSGNIRVAPASAAPEEFLTGSNGIQDITGNTPASTQFELQGNMMIQGSVGISGSMRAGQVAATAGAFDNASSTTGMKPRTPISSMEPIEVDQVDLDSLNTITGLHKTAIAALQETLFNDYSVYTAAFAYPDSAVWRVASAYLMPSMRWQSMCGGTQTWSEPEVLDADGEATMVYPGITAWSDGNILMKDYSNSSLATGYITNLKT